MTQHEYQAKIQEILSESNSLARQLNKSETVKSASSPHDITLFSSRGNGIVEDTITPKQPGRVKYQATYWPARFYDQDEQVNLLPNDPVYVIGRQGLTLLVVPVSKEVTLT